MCLQEGRGLLEGWSILAEKFCHLSVGLFIEARLPPAPANYRSVDVGFSSKEGTKCLYVDAIRKVHSRVGEAI